MYLEAAFHRAASWHNERHFRVLCYFVDESVIAMDEFKVATAHMEVDAARSCALSASVYIMARPSMCFR